MLQIKRLREAWCIKAKVLLTRITQVQGSGVENTAAAQAYPQSSLPSFKRGSAKAGSWGVDIYLL